MTATTSTRLWWRLSDVVPLAEHAMAVPAHRLTGAQVCAGQATQPALVWTSDPTGDWLASNGVPGWYDREGASHQAQALTWRHPPSGANGSPGQPDPAAGFLPLTHHDATSAWRHRPALIDVLRRGARTGAHWFTLDTTTTGTGRFAVSDHRHDIAPPTATWVPAAVTSPSVEDQCYPALVADGYTTGDGVIARFDRAAVSATAEYLLDRHLDQNPATDLMPGELPLLRIDGPAVAVLWTHDDGLRERWVEVDRVYPDHEGRYAVGAFHWRWSATDD